MLRHRMRVSTVLTVVFFTIVGATMLAGPAAAAGGQPVELIQNGGFETGGLAPWTTTTTGNQYCVSGQSGWRVGTLNVQNGNCMHTIQPAAGTHDVLMSLDGGGPYSITLAQTVTVPAHASATLSWSDWVDVRYSGQPRNLSVRILDATTNAVLGTVYSYSPTGWTNTNWQAHSVDVSAFAGQTVKVAFVAFVPQYYTGPGQLDLDSISLVAVQNDTTPPVFGPLPSPTAEATSADGAVVSYATPTVTDDTDSAPTVACTPASGSTFAIGATTVTCTATDASGNASTATFDVTVQDTTAPVVTVPASFTIDSTGPAGATATFAASATDIVDGVPATVCAPASGSTFAAGSTTVTCSSTDAHGNTGTGTFTVTVRSAAEMLGNLGTASYGVGPGKSLGEKVASAQQALAAGNTTGAIAMLTAFTKEVAAQSGKKLTAAQAADLTARAQGVIATLGG